MRNLETMIHVNRYAVTRSGLELFANFHYSPECQSASKPRGIVVSYHPGGMFTGSRDMDFIFPTVKQAILKAGYILVQPGHRLLIPSSGHDILQDVRSFLTYLESDQYLASLPSGVIPDLSKILVSGFSGGGYVARLAAIELHKRKLQAQGRLACVGLLSYFGMGGDLLKRPWIREAGPEDKEFDQMNRLYANSEVSDSPYPPEKRLKGWENDIERAPVWDWWNNVGTLPDTLCGTRGELRRRWTTSTIHQKAEDIVPDAHHDLFPQIYFDRLKPSEAFPITMLVHGTADELVPYKESVTTLHQLRVAGVGVQLVTVPEVDHWLRLPGKAESPIETEQAHGKVVAFIKQCLDSLA